MNMNKKQNGTIQIDVDEIWVLLKYFGYKYRDSDHVYSGSILRMLDLFEEYNFKVTFFIVGKDGKTRAKRKVLNQIVERGHELANHSLTHLDGLAEYPYKVKEKEVLETDKILSDITGKKICGFRAPGYSVDEEILDILEENGYLYDSSMFPSYFCPLIKFAQKNDVPKSAYGTFKNGFAPLSVYRPLKGKMWKRGNRCLIEVPVTVIPFLRIPFHSAYVNMTHTKLFDFGFFLSKNFGAVFNYVLHGVELVDELKDSRIPQEFKVDSCIKKRLATYNHILSKISKYYTIITSKDLATSSI